MSVAKETVGSKEKPGPPEAAAADVTAESRFTKVVLSDDLNEPMELAVAPDERVFFIERAGNFYMYDPRLKKTRLLHAFEFPAKAVNALNGLLGLTLDPDFRQNDYIYFFKTANDSSQYRQQISRFKLTGDNNLDLKSEKVILEIPIDVAGRTHTGGSLAWDKDRNLYIATGDNTSATESDGFAPINELPGRLNFDAQRSSGNTNDLRGKILRIHPEPDGTYTIPKDNLFPAGTPDTRPEIYVMGARNPYRISVDTATSAVYWGDVGPDAGTSGSRGSKGFDEFNQAREAGNYGWPYFIGDNRAYSDYDFATKTIGQPFDAKAPVNNSPNNTGAATLPPAQKALIWYPYDQSNEFPALGTGGRSAMAGPVYHYDPNLPSETKLPQYYDKALFIMDWMRNWIFAVRLDTALHYKSMEPFMPVTGNFIRPVDMEIGPDGAVYLLEYGTVYGKDNPDARLVRIDYNAGNRAPVAQIITTDTIGLAPFKVAFSSKSYDHDAEDRLTYAWRFGDGGITSTEPNPTHTYSRDGIYKATLKVTDPAGKADTDTLEIKVGNTLPEISIQLVGNSSFFSEDRTPIKYTVRVEDREDKEIDEDKVLVTLNYTENPTSMRELMRHAQNPGAFDLGKSLMENSDCKACHQLDKTSVGPAFMDVAKRYQGDETATARLANKIITGGGGVWGDGAMNAHPQLSREEASDIVKYILTLSTRKPVESLPLQGTLVLKDHVGKAGKGRYLLTASYTDKGGAITPLSASRTLVLRPAKVQAAEADTLYHLDKKGDKLEIPGEQSYFVLMNVDLKAIDRLAFRYASQNQEAAVEVHIDSLAGPVISALHIKPTQSLKNFVEVNAPVRDPGGTHDLFFLFKGKNASAEASALLDWIRFGQ
ncbi:PQQ-dependent sugar dehydrogenase [Pontibacter russatus]|uniref:PQQ-dependent sugar dehydrogenase n=1 Tax=Pontibacter russatus TaxID=2694929 RepID=UPI001F2CF880|nr:PQQ-dependent sugar dehydrogenase [Pontibacter russatus]